MLAAETMLNARFSQKVATFRHTPADHPEQGKLLQYLRSGGDVYEFNLSLKQSRRCFRSDLPEPEYFQRK